MRRFLILTMAVLAGGLLPACGDDPTGPESVAGTYILQTINGEALPVTVQTDVVSAGSLQLNSAGTFTLSFTIDGRPDSESGTFTVDGSTVTLVDEGDVDEGDSITGTVSGNTITFVAEGDTFVLTK